MEKTTIVGDYEKIIFERDKIVEKESVPMKIIVNKMPEKPEDCIFSYEDGNFYPPGVVYRCKLKSASSFCEICEKTNCSLLESQKGYWTMYVCGTTLDPCDCEYKCSKCGQISEQPHKVCPDCFTLMEDFDDSVIEDLKEKIHSHEKNTACEKIQQQIFESLGVSKELLELNSNKED